METSGRCHVLPALNNEQAEKIFGELKNDIDIIVCDFSLGGGETTLNFVKKIRGEFKGLMIANSSDPGSNERLVEAGCDVSTKKSEMLDLIKNLISE